MRRKFVRMCMYHQKYERRSLAEDRALDTLCSYGPRALYRALGTFHPPLYRPSPTACLLRGCGLKMTASARAFQRCVTRAHRMPVHSAMSVYRHAFAFVGKLSAEVVVPEHRRDATRADGHAVGDGRRRGRRRRPTAPSTSRPHRRPWRSASRPASATRPSAR